VVITFLITLTLSSGVISEDRELIGLGEASVLECVAKKRQHEFTKYPPFGADGVKFICTTFVGEEI
jgi:hypothetical protein